MVINGSLINAGMAVGSAAGGLLLLIVLLPAVKNKREEAFHEED